MKFRIVGPEILWLTSKIFTCFINEYYRNWEHFWLNEGFTVYIERRILSRMYKNREEGEEFATFHAMIGYNHLQESLDRFEELKQPQYTKMIPDLSRVDPDDAFSSVPYEKYV